MDKQLISARFGKAAAVYDREAVVQRRIARKMITLIEEHLPAGCWNIYEVGCGTGIFSRLLIQHLKPHILIMNDICPDMPQNLADITGKLGVFVPGDAETQPIPEGMDMVASCSAIQWFANLNAFLGRCHTALNDTGRLAFSSFGEDNMKEINALTGIGLPYPTKPELEKMLTSLHYNIVHASEEKINLLFDTPASVLHHLKRTGVTGIRTQRWTKGTLENFCREYSRRYGSGNSVTLTYHPVYIIAKKRQHEK
jgi:malonyl-ACP O-methyltransferase BioC